MQTSNYRVPPQFILSRESYARGQLLTNPADRDSVER